MNSGTKYTLVIAAVLLGAAVMPALAFVAGLIVLGMGLHAMLSSGGTTMPGNYDQIDYDTRKKIEHAQRRLDREL